MQVSFHNCNSCSIGNPNNQNAVFLKQFKISRTSKRKEPKLSLFRGRICPRIALDPVHKLHGTLSIVYINKTRLISSHYVRSSPCYQVNSE